MKLYAGKTYVCRNTKTVTLENDTLLPVFSCRENDYLYSKEDVATSSCVISIDTKHPWDIVCELFL